nr:MAG TPA: hypothetical protein [Caudoviricetes sp.]
MANDTDDEFSGFSSDDFSEFFDEPQESSSVSEVPGSQERSPPSGKKPAKTMTAMGNSMSLPGPAPERSRA